jgi:hypothetical protein
MFSIFKDIESFEDKRHDIRFTRKFQLLEYQTSFLNSIFSQCFAYLLEKMDVDWG